MSAPGDRLREACVTVLFSGHLRPANATWGSLAATLLFLAAHGALAAGGAARGVTDLVAIPLVVGLACALSVRLGPWAIARFRSADPKPFVLDELAGQWIALFLLPVGPSAGAVDFACVAAGQWLLFRVFDVLKVPPAAQLERLPAGWGVLCDDLAAGVYANVAGQALWRWTPLGAWLGLAAN